ncbi:unnamed protein product, partial [Sphagnum balticum]
MYFSSRSCTQERVRHTHTHTHIPTYPHIRNWVPFQRPPVQEFVRIPSPDLQRHQPWRIWWWKLCG